MTRMRELLVQTTQYLAGRAGLMLLGLLSFPVLTRILPVAQYGELSLALKLCLLWTVLSKCGLQNAALRYFPEYSRGSLPEKRACSSSLVITISVIAGVLVFAGFAIVRLSRLATIPAVAGLAPLLLLLAFVRSIQPTFSGLLRSERRAWLFNACELSGKAMGIVFSITALLLIARDLRFYVSSLVAAEGVVVIAIGAWFYRNGLLSLSSFQPRFAKRAMVFSLPLIAYELTSVILDSGDRILIGKYLGLTQLGLYSAAYSVATYAEEALMVPVNMALMPTYMNLWVEEGAASTARFLSESLDLFVMGCGAVALFVYVNAHDLLAILASRKFAAASSLLPILVLGLLVYAGHIFFNAPFIIYKRSIILTCVTTASCVFNVIMNVVLLPRMGIGGAAWATLASYVVMVGALALISRRYLVVRFPIATLICSASLVLVIQQLMNLGGFSSPWLNLVTKTPASVVLYAFGLFLFRPALRSRILTRLPRQFATYTRLSGAEE